MFAQSMFEIVFSCGEEMETPVEFKEAWNHNDSTEKEKWREAIMHELKCMKKRKVWDVEYPNKKPRTIGLKWVFKMKKRSKLCVDYLTAVS